MNYNDPKAIENLLNKMTIELGRDQLAEIFKQISQPYSHFDIALTFVDGVKFGLKMGANTAEAAVDTIGTSLSTILKEEFKK